MLASINLTNSTLVFDKQKDGLVHVYLMGETGKVDEVILNTKNDQDAESIGKVMATLCQ